MCLQRAPGKFLFWPPGDFAMSHRCFRDGDTREQRGSQEMGGEVASCKPHVGPSHLHGGSW